MKLWQDIKSIEDAPWRGAFNFISRYSYFDNPSHFSRVLAARVEIEPHVSRLLDIGSASGIIGLYSLIVKKAAFVTFTNVTEVGISESRCNAIRQLEKRRIIESQVDFIGPVSFAKLERDVVAKHTVMAFNPPQLPLDYLESSDREKINSDRTMKYYRSGGGDGLKTVRDFLRWYGKLERPAPHLVINLSSFLGCSRIDKALRERGFTYTIAKTRVPLRERLTTMIHTLSRDEIIDKCLKQKRRNGAVIWTKELLTVSIDG
jgi:methylase of polypeptide subunit release factors